MISCVGCSECEEELPCPECHGVGYLQNEDTEEQEGFYEYCRGDGYVIESFGHYCPAGTE